MKIKDVLKWASRLGLTTGGCVGGGNAGERTAAISQKRRKEN